MLGELTQDTSFGTRMVSLICCIAGVKVRLTQPNLDGNPNIIFGTQKGSLVCHSADFKVRLS